MLGWSMLTTIYVSYTMTALAICITATRIWMGVPGSLSAEAKNYAITHPKEMLMQYGWLMLRDLLDCPDLSNCAGEERWHYPNKLHVFSGTTFVDGSCIPCRSHP